MEIQKGSLLSRLTDCLSFILNADAKGYYLRGYHIGQDVQKDVTRDTRSTSYLKAPLCEVRR